MTTAVQQLVLPGPGEMRIHAGTLAHYARLSRAHYRPSPPATVALVLSASIGAECIAAMLISFPARHGPWREIAWPGRFHSIAAINLHLRVISRVVVSPEFRARGVASALVRAYLACPLTRCTEALAAMRCCSPLFLRAGMRPVAYPPARRVLRLLAVLRTLEIEPWMLADPDGLLAGRWCPRSRLPVLRRHLATFARAHQDTRGLAAAPLVVLIGAALPRLHLRPIAFVHECTPPSA